MNRVSQITPKEAKQKLDANNGNFLIIDVREDNEVNFSSIKEKFIHVKLSEFQTHINEIPKDKELGILCRSGSRSAQVTNFLNYHGYNAVNISGGINYWADSVDSSIQKYALRNHHIIPM